jgi:hypothetical protein
MLQSMWPAFAHLYTRTEVDALAKTLNGVRKPLNM